MAPLRTVSLTAEESVHYALTGPDAYDEWLATSPPGTGMARLGPDHRPLFLAMFHQLHCLRYFRNTLSGAGGPPRWAHLHHCFTYIRQAVLCDADTTLEPGNFMERDFETERIGATYQCRDWEAVYGELTREWDAWGKLKDEIGYVVEVSISITFVRSRVAEL